VCSSDLAFANSIRVLQKDYPPDNFYALQNLLDSHDVDRISSQIVNPDRWYDHNASARDNKNYDERKPDKTEIQKQKLAVAIQMTMPGAPMVYYGDESGMWGGDDPDCRKPMVWANMKYETESADPLGRQRPADPVYFDNDLFNWYKNLISIRENNKALSLGDLEFFLTDNSNKILGYKRVLNNKTIFVMINNKNENSEVEINFDKHAKLTGQLTDLITGTTIKNKNNIYKVKLSPFGVKILE
jgi:glycosidase